MSKTIERLRVLLGAMPTYIVILSVVISTVGTEVSKLLPSGWQDNAGQITAWLVAAIGAATVIVRNVTRVLDDQKGLLGPKVKTIRDNGQATPGIIWTVVGILFAIVLIILIVRYVNVDDDPSGLALFVGR